MEKTNGKNRGLEEAIAEMRKSRITASGLAGMKSLLKSEKLMPGPSGKTFHTKTSS